SNIKILQIMYSYEDHKASASEIGRILGHNGKNTSSPVNSEIGNWGKRLVKQYPVRFTKREDGTERKWDVFFDGWQERYFFIWKIKSELVKALQEAGLTGEELYPEEIPLQDQVVLTEGQKKIIIVNSYERNPKARQKCIEYWKALCAVCGFDFEQTYGDLGKGFIHVHHFILISDMVKNYQIDLVNDLRPVCPNCHSMIHKTDPPLTIEELKEQLR